MSTFCHTRIMRRLVQITVLAAFVFSCGGHWYVLQAVAWVNMIRDFSHMVPFTEAVSMTFSGKYPCEYCQLIEKKKQDSANQSCAIKKYDKKFSPAFSLAVRAVTASPCNYPDWSPSWSEHSEAPPTPPPRRA